MDRASGSHAKPVMPPGGGPLAPHSHGYSDGLQSATQARLTHANELVASCWSAIEAMREGKLKAKSFKEEGGKLMGASFAAVLALQEVLAAAAAAASAGGGEGGEQLAGFSVGGGSGSVQPPRFDSMNSFGTSGSSATSGGGGGGKRAPSLLFVLRVGAEVRIGLGHAAFMLQHHGQASWTELLLRPGTDAQIKAKFKEVGGARAAGRVLKSSGQDMGKGPQNHGAAAGLASAEARLEGRAWPARAPHPPHACARPPQRPAPRPTPRLPTGHRGAHRPGGDALVIH
jgi:hypothetical protein